MPAESDEKFVRYVEKPPPDNILFFGVLNVMSNALTELLCAMQKVKCQQTLVLCKYLKNEAWCDKHQRLSNYWHRIFYTQFLLHCKSTFG